MKWLCVGLIVLPALFLVGMQMEDQDQLKTVKEFELDKYLGKWYAVASIPRFFNRSCAWGNKAEYKLRDDGRIDVLNTCYTENGKKREARAVGWIPNSLEPGKLKVSFLPLFGYRLFAADYWILELGDDYEYAVVGHPNRSFGWILSRKPEINSETLEGIADRLESMGYDFSDFEMNTQIPPEER